METSTRGDFSQKDSNKSERKDLQGGSDVWFEDGDTDKKNHSAISETLPINITIQSSKQCSGGV